MTRKAGWQGSSTGPDWIDVMGMMNAIGALHSGHVEVNARVDGIGFDSVVMVKALMTFELLPGSSLPKEVVVESAWPCDKHPTFSAHVYSLLYTLDAEIGKVYRNETLWK